ncbi:MAG: Holliday junction resolvase RuvX [Anaerolineales bacterium]
MLAVDPGEKRHGIAISDPTGTIANPLMVLSHISREQDAAAIVGLVHEHQVGLIVLGQSLDDEGRSTLQSRRTARLANAIRSQTQVPVELWDETGSTQSAREARIAMGAPRRKRGGHLDDIAATYILQTYLDSNRDDLPS